MANDLALLKRRKLAGSEQRRKRHAKAGLEGLRARVSQSLLLMDALDKALKDAKLYKSKVESLERENMELKKSLYEVNRKFEFGENWKFGNLWGL